MLLVALAATLPWVSSERYRAPLAMAQQPAEIGRTSGLLLTLLSVLPERPIDARVSRMAALHVEEGEPVSPFFEPSPFMAHFRGVLRLRLREDVRFLATGSGSLKIFVNEALVYSADGDLAAAPAGDEVRLQRGANALRIEYASGGAASMRVLWSVRNGYPEPIPPDLLEHDSADALLARQSQYRLGRELVASRRCVSCHTADVPVALPEAEARPPSLDGITEVFTDRFLSRWVLDPQSLRDDTAMPRVVSDEADARNLVAYLLRESPAPQAAPAPAFEPAQVEKGQRLFVSLGCFTCHTAPGGDETVERLGRVSLEAVRAKYRSATQLLAFIRDPHARYPHSPMPRFELAEAESAALAAYVWSATREDAIAPVDLGGADVERGEAVYVQSCLPCHTPEESPPASIAMADLKDERLIRGCLSLDADRRGAAPDFNFSTVQRDAIVATLVGARTSLGRDPVVESASRALAALRCTSCHVLDGQPSTWDALEDEARALLAALGPDPDAAPGDPTRPLLTWSGEKLHRDWSKRLVAGELPRRPRPWLTARMPHWPRHAELLATGLARMHGISERREPDLTPEPQRVADGKRLAGVSGGLGCIQCHAIGDQPALAAFEASALDFDTIRDRLRRDFYQRWMRNPQHYAPGTRMPQFADKQGKTAILEIEQGSAARQFTALWHYIIAGRW